MHGTWCHSAEIGRVCVLHQAGALEASSDLLGRLRSHGNRDGGTRVPKRYEGAAWMPIDKGCAIQLDQAFGRVDSRALRRQGPKIWRKLAIAAIFKVGLVLLGLLGFIAFCGRIPLAKTKGIRRTLGLALNLKGKEKQSYYLR